MASHKALEAAQALKDLAAGLESGEIDSHASGVLVLRSQEGKYTLAAFGRDAQNLKGLIELGLKLD